MRTKTTGPKCPNHGIGLVDCQKGVGICPISGCRFAYDEEQAAKTRRLRLTAFGQMEETADWAVTPLDGEGG